MYQNTCVSRTLGLLFALGRIGPSLRKGQRHYHRFLAEECCYQLFIRQDGNTLGALAATPSSLNAQSMLCKLVHPPSNKPQSMRSANTNYL